MGLGSNDPGASRPAGAIVAVEEGIPMPEPVVPDAVFAEAVHLASIDFLPTSYVTSAHRRRATAILARPSPHPSPAAANQRPRGSIQGASALCTR